MINLFKKNKRVKIADTTSKHNFRVENNVKENVTYSESALKSMKDAIETEKIFGQLGSIAGNGGVNLTRATHKVTNPKLKDGILTCEIEFLETPYVEEALGYLTDHEFDIFTFKPEGNGAVDPKEKIIYNYTLNSVNIFIESDD